MAWWNNRGCRRVRRDIMVADQRLSTDLWVRAHLRRLIASAIPATVARKGSPESGTVLLKLNLLQSGVKVLSQIRDLEGRLGWMTAFEGQAVSEAEADAYLERQVARDPDLWIIEIEDRQGRHGFDGPILS